jgi:hypothetical protein
VNKFFFLNKASSADGTQNTEQERKDK